MEDIPHARPLKGSADFGSGCWMSGLFCRCCMFSLFVAALCDLVVLPPQCHAGVELMLELLVMARKWLR